MNESIHNNPDPYRTPGEIPETSEVAKKGILKSPWPWIMVAAAIGTIVAVVGFTRTDVQEFGITRGGPVREEPGTDEYEREMLSVYEPEVIVAQEE